MKKILSAICILLLLAFTACKKGANPDYEQTFVQEGAVWSPLGFGGMKLRLMAEGKADLLLAGDVYYRGTYSTMGNKIIVKIDQQKYEFEILSHDQLRYDKTIILNLELKV
ncbi:MAG: hypothetical protein REI78_00205 [Pedobacter sp.]|nr:hypothetical protein [Pedobacter sp.]